MKTFKEFLNEKNKLTRIAILLGAAQKGDPLASTVTQDLQAMENHLLSPIGGSWVDEEIIPLENRPVGEIKQVMKDVKDMCDFVFFYWTGHGCHDEYSRILMEQHGGKDLLLNTFFNLAERQLMIVDTCRAPHPRIKSKKNFSVTASINENFDGLTEIARIIYDNGIKDSWGQQIAYSCSNDEESRYDEGGQSAFSELILQASNKWICSKPVEDILTVSKVVKYAKNSLYNTGQKPKFTHSKNVRQSYPFAVNPLS